MTVSFEWKDSYSVNNELMDHQHRRLLDLATKVMQSGDDIDRLQSNLNSLYSHTLEHFRAEERLMREYGFPGYVNHRACHDRIMDQFHALISRSRFDIQVASGLEEFMVQWVLEHIVNDDMELAGFLG